MSLGYDGQAGFRKIRNKLRNVVGSPDISMSYNVITSKHDSEGIESLKQELCLKDNNETIIWARGN